MWQSLPKDLVLDLVTRRIAYVLQKDARSLHPAMPVTEALDMKDLIDYEEDEGPESPQHYFEKTFFDVFVCHPPADLDLNDTLDQLADKIRKDRSCSGMILIYSH